MFLNLIQDPKLSRQSMKMRRPVLFLFVGLPGLIIIATNIYYLIPEWAALEKSDRVYGQAVDSFSTIEKLIVTKIAQEIHRINGFVKGVRLVLRGVIISVGIQGICTLPRQTSR